MNFAEKIDIAAVKRAFGELEQVQREEAQLEQELDTSEKLLSDLRKTIGENSAEYLAEMRHAASLRGRFWETEDRRQECERNPIFRSALKQFMERLRGAV